MARQEMIQVITAKCSDYPDSYWDRFSDSELQIWIDQITDYDLINIREAQFA